MKNCFTKPLLGLLLVGLTGCGANNAANVAGVATPGSISAQLAWGGAAGKSARALVATGIPSEVRHIQLTVTGSGANGAIPVVRSASDVDPATSSTQVSAGGIYPGTVAVAVKALDVNNAVVYEGYAVNVKVAASATTTVGTITMAIPLAKAEEKQCLGCHETTLDATGQNVVANYKQSSHYANVDFKDANGVGAGCVGCHGPSHNVPNPSAGGAQARCFECHSDKVGVHFNNYTGETRPAMYASTNETCASCHQVHNTKVGQDERKAFAKSGHGDVRGAAWSDEDFGASCQRCHSGTGFKNFAVSNFQTFPTTSVYSAEDKKREVLVCDACHTDNKFGVRATGPFTSQYKIKNNTVTATFPDVGESNLCIACHSARENGVDAVADFTNASFKNSHYLPAAGVMYMSAGFTNFTSASATIGSSTYGKTLTPDSGSVPNFGMTGGVSSSHRILGTTLLAAKYGASNSALTAGHLDANGPCVVCHMNANGAASGTREAHGHSLAIDENAYNQVCINCHTAENTVSINATNFKTVFIEPQSEAFQAALKLAVTLLQSKYSIVYDSATYPYFFKNGVAVKNWTNGTGSAVIGKKLMGACFNIQLLTKDPAAYAHARSYSRRLLYDTIDFLDDGIINLSVGTTAVNSGLTKDDGSLLFTKGTKGYNPTSSTTGVNGSGVATYGITTPATGTSEAMLYLIGWNRSGTTNDANASTGAGAWTSPERP